MRAGAWILPALLGLAACSGRPAAVPRQHAYPRVNLYPAEYREVRLPAAPGAIAVNDSARVDSVGPGWFNIVYPAYNLTVNCTLLPYSAEAVANRRERMDLNLAGARAEVVETPRGVMVVAPGAMRTPVQFLATDSAGWILSGVAVATLPADADADSVAPVVDALSTDILFMLNQL